MTIQRLQTRLTETAVGYDMPSPKEKKSLIKQWKEQVTEFYQTSGEVTGKVVFKEKGKKLLWDVTFKLPGKTATMQELQDWLQEMELYNEDIGEETEGGTEIKIDFAKGVAYTSNSINITDLDSALNNPHTRD